jgi:hypothetical protein
MPRRRLRLGNFSAEFIAQVGSKTLIVILKVIELDEFAGNG